MVSYNSIEAIKFMSIISINEQYTKHLEFKGSVSNSLFCTKIDTVFVILLD